MTILQNMVYILLKINKYFFPTPNDIRPRKATQRQLAHTTEGWGAFCDRYIQPYRCWWHMWDLLNISRGPKTMQ